MYNENLENIIDVVPIKEGGNQCDNLDITDTIIANVSGNIIFSIIILFTLFLIFDYFYSTYFKNTFDELSITLKHVKNGLVSVIKLLEKLTSGGLGTVNSLL